MLDVECKGRTSRISILSMSTVRTRIAPSPTGEDIHIGNLYTALLNYAVAKRNDGKFIVRIEDTDRERLVLGSEERILRTLRDYKLAYDEGPDKPGKFGPYRQSDRLDIYKRYVLKLIHSGHAYYCFCSKERLLELRTKQQDQKQTPRYDKYCLTHVTNAKERIEKGEQYVIRLNVPKDQEIIFKDLIRGMIRFDSHDIDDQVLLKSDGFPTYHLAVVVDDHLMKITHVIRAEDWISSTPKHVLLYNAFGWDLPLFAHVPLLRNPDKSKLSKRKNPVWARWYLDEGFLPEAVLNFLALMGWSHPEEKEYFSLMEFISLFEITDVKPVGPIFDLTKLTWMNQHYIQRLSTDSLKARLIEYYKNDHDMKTIRTQYIDSFDAIVEISKTRIKTLKDFFPLVRYLIYPPEIGKLNDEQKKVVLLLHDVFRNVSDWKSEEIFEAMKKLMSEYRSTKMPVFYVLFTGNKQGLPLPEMLEILGKDETLKRLNNMS